MKKICSRCGGEKDLDQFYLIQASAPERGHRARCKSCLSELNPKSTPESRARKAELARKYRAAEPHRRWVSYLKRYGWTPDDYFRQLALQDDRCATCLVTEDEAGTRFSVDHDHACCPGQKTCGECNRGLLCRLCNAGLGMFKDSPESLRRAADYLEKSIPQ